MAGLVDREGSASVFKTIANALQFVWMVFSGEIFMAIFAVWNLVAAASRLPCLPRSQGSNDAAEVRVPACSDAQILAALARALGARQKRHVLVQLRVGFGKSNHPVLL